MYIVSLLALSAMATTAIAGENNIKFLFSSSASLGIQNLGSSFSSGFTLFDNDDNILFESEDDLPTCSRDTNHIEITSDCWEGIWDFSCGSSFSGTPGACSAYAPDTTETKGEANDEFTPNPFGNGQDGECSGTITTYSDGECTKDSLVTILRTYQGMYTHDK
jgi:hypothetical protein